MTGYYGSLWSGTQLPNCTGCTYGYLLKYLNKTDGEKAWSGNAKDWVKKASNISGYTNAVQSTPTANSIAVFGPSAGNPKGHVAWVTDWDGTYLTMYESGEKFYSKTGNYILKRKYKVTNSDFTYPSTGYKCLGFVPAVGGSGTSGGGTENKSWTATDWKGSNTRFYSCSYSSKANIEKNASLEAKNNAQMIAKWVKNNGGSLKTACALIGNMCVESTLNPIIYEGQTVRDWSVNKGFGLIQWTPASVLRNDIQTLGHTMPTYNNPDQTNLNLMGDYEMEVVKAEIVGTISGYYFIGSSVPTAYRISGSDFWTGSNYTLHDMVGAYMYCRERPASYSTLENRATYAQAWYDYLSQFWNGTATDDTSGDPETSKALRIQRTRVFYMSCNRHRKKH